MQQSNRIVAVDRPIALRGHTADLHTPSSLSSQVCQICPGRLQIILRGHNPAQKDRALGATAGRHRSPECPYPIHGNVLGSLPIRHIADGVDGCDDDAQISGDRYLQVSSSKSACNALRIL
jgi:hypothetical protein